MLEAILNTLLMNDKSKDTAKARQDLKMLGIRSGLWLGQTKNGKCSKPQAAYSFSPENRKSFASSSKELNYQMGSDPTSSTKRAYSPRWMFPFKIFMKKLKGYVRNKAKPEGSIAEGYAAEEALTFKSKKVIWYVLQNNPEIDTYRSQFKSKFPNKYMKEEFPDWFGSQIRQRQVDNEPGVSTTSELFALACGPTPTLISVNSCVVNDVRNEGRKVKHLFLRKNTTQILTKGEAFKDDQYILATQVKKYFYLEDMARRQPHWKVDEHVNHKKFSGGGVIVVEEDPDVIHFVNSSDLPFSTSLNDLDNATLHIDGQSMEVDAPPDIIDLDENDDIIDDEDALPYDLADSDNEDIININDDDGVDMSANVARGHGGDGGGDDHPPTHHVPTGCGGCFVNRGKGTRKPNLGGRKAGGLHTRQETRNLGLTKITDDKGPVQIRFEWDNKKTMMPLALDRYQCGHPAAFAKVVQYQKGFPHGSALGYKPRDLTTWKASCSDVLRTLPRQIGMPRLPSGMIPGTKPEPLKIAKTKQRARSYAGRDPSHFLAFEIRWVLPRRATNVLSPPPPQCTYNTADVEKLKKKNKHPTKQVNLMMKLFRSDDKFSQMLNQYESSPEFGNASGSGGCEDDEMVDDEDGDEDEADEVDGDS
nr:hypothetical protein [Tanacetum cinerariifolium]